MTEQTNSSNSINVLDETYQTLRQAWIDSKENKDQAGINTVTQKLENLANEGYGKAICLLGVIFNHPENKQRDEIRALDHFEQAMKMKVPAAFYNMSLAYAQRKDYDKSFQFAQQGAELGDDECMRRLGIHLINGLGTTKDGLSGVRWIKKAVDAGNKDALLNYAEQLIDGDLISADLPKAIELLEKLYAEKSDADVAWQLFRAYTRQGNKDGNPDSKKKGGEWARIAADLGHQAAIEMQASCKKQDLWDSLKNFSIGDESYSFFYKSGKVEDKRTETRSNTHSVGYGRNQTVRTTHTSWQEIDLRDTNGNKFTVFPDSTLTISSGAEVEVAYICKGEEDTGYAVIMVERDSGKEHVVESAEKARTSVGYGQGNMGCLLAVAMIFIGFIGTILLFGSGTGFFGTLIGLGLLASSVTVLFKQYSRKNEQISALAAHIGKISNFLKQQ